MNNYSVGLVGVSGYSGRELLRLLEGHGGVRPVVIPRESEAGAAVPEHGLDLLFLATPHEVSLEAAPAALAALLRPPVRPGREFRPG